MHKIITNSLSVVLAITLIVGIYINFNSKQVQDPIYIVNLNNPDEENLMVEYTAEVMRKTSEVDRPLTSDEVKPIYDQYVKRLEILRASKESK